MFTNKSKKAYRVCVPNKRWVIGTYSKGFMMKVRRKPLVKTIGFIDD